jgi:hypothetical protein
MNEQNKKIVSFFFHVIFFIIVLTDLVQKIVQNTILMLQMGRHGPIELPLIKDSKCW